MVLSHWFGASRAIKVKNHMELVEILVKNNGTMGCKIFLKAYIFDVYLDQCKENMGAY